MKITQIITGPYGNIYGLGDDNKIYIWSADSGNWNLYKGYKVG